MQYFKYVGRTEKGYLKRGTIQSKSRNQAIIDLKAQGIQPRELTETKPSIFTTDISIGNNAVKHRDFIIYCRQFATLIRAGITIVDATNILAHQTDSKGLKKALLLVESELRDGRSFSEAVKSHPKIFPTIFVHMIEAGEMTGNLDETLDRLATYFEKQYNIRKKVQSTMAYPIVLTFVIIAVVIFLMLAIIPNFLSMFEQMGSELPFVTQLVVNISNFVQQSWWVLLSILLVVIGIFIYLYRQNKAFNYSVHVMLLRMPIFGQLLQKSAIARMSRTLASLFSSSVPILQALGIVAKVVNNPVIGKVVLEARENLESGQSLSEPLKKSWVFPPLVSHMTAIGEETGSLDYMLEKIADFYEEDVDRTVDTLRTLIEPLMIILLAGVVGFIVLSIMVPMLSIFTDFN